MDVQIAYMGAVGSLVKNQGTETGRGLVTWAVQKSEKTLANKFVPDYLFLLPPGCHIYHGSEGQPLEILKPFDTALHVLT
jgi:hypothetical protein